jgi:hypothetical protein
VDFVPRDFVDTKTAFLSFTVGMLAAYQVFAQDPGSPDSIVVENTAADHGDTLVTVRISAVTDDPVAFYNLPLVFDAPLGGFVLDTSYVVSDPPLLSLWDEVYYDYVEAQEFIRMFGFWDTGGEDNPPMNTGNERIGILEIVFGVEEDTPDQYVTIGQTDDPVGGSVTLGLSDGLTGFVPAFVPGVITYGNPTGVRGNGDALPGLLALRQNYPNPFNPRTTIEFWLPEGDYVTLSIYNLLGQEVRKLADGAHEAGYHVVVWEGKDDAGVDVPSGVYFCKLLMGTEFRTTKMVLIR